MIMISSDNYSCIYIYTYVNLYKYKVLKQEYINIMYLYISIYTQIYTYLHIYIYRQVYNYRYIIYMYV